jgi:hypothetical protein
MGHIIYVRSIVLAVNATCSVDIAQMMTWHRETLCQQLQQQQQRQQQWMGGLCHSQADFYQFIIPVEPTLNSQDNMLRCAGCPQVFAPAKFQAEVLKDRGEHTIVQVSCCNFAQHAHLCISALAGSRGYT